MIENPARATSKFQLYDLTKTLFIDIETVPEHPSYRHLDAAWGSHWQDKWRKTRSTRYRIVFDRDLPDAADTDMLAEAEAAYREAGLYAEFGRICCITVGRFRDYTPEKGNRHFQVTSFYGTDEKALLEKLCQGFSRLNMHEMSGTGSFNDKRRYAWNLCGHNVREFDVPYICRRLMVHGMNLPSMLDCAGLKPWEVPHVVDTLELWKFGDNKNYTSLNLLAHRFQVPSPKEALDGSKVFDAFLENRHDEIGRYCGLDVLTVAQLLLRWRNEELLDDTEVQMEMKAAMQLVVA